MAWHVRHTLLASLMIALQLGACSGSSTPEPSANAVAPEAPGPQAEPAAEPVKPAAAAQPAGPAPSAVEDPTFSLRMVEAGPYKAGELGRFVIELQPKGVYHVNKEYPLEIALTSTADGVLPKGQLAKADAAEFGDTKARFDVPVSPKAAGPVSINANIKFAVCTEENCVPDERNLTLALAVQ